MNKRHLIFFLVVSFFAIKTYSQNAHETWDSLKKDRKKVILQLDLGISSSSYHGYIGFTPDASTLIENIREAGEFTGIFYLKNSFFLATGISYRHFNISRAFGIGFREDMDVKYMGADVNLLFKKYIFERMSAGFFAGGSAYFFTDVNRRIFYKNERQSKYDWNYKGIPILLVGGFFLDYRCSAKTCIGLDLRYEKQMNELMYPINSYPYEYHFNVEYYTLAVSLKYRL